MMCKMMPLHYRENTGVQQTVNKHGKLRFLFLVMYGTGTRQGRYRTVIFQSILESHTVAGTLIRVRLFTLTPQLIRTVLIRIWTQMEVFDLPIKQPERPIRLRIKVKIQEASRLKMNPWRVCMQQPQICINLMWSRIRVQREKSDPDQHQSDEDPQHSNRIKIQALLNPNPMRIWNQMQTHVFLRSKLYQVNI